MRGFCPDCGATVYYTLEGAEDRIADPVGSFADPSFPAPTRAVHESRRHRRTQPIVAPFRDAGS